MKVRYDEDVEVLYIQLADSRIEDSEMLSPGVVVDYDAEDRIVGIELLHVKELTLERVGLKAVAQATGDS